MPIILIRLNSNAVSLKSIGPGKNSEIDGAWKPPPSPSLNAKADLKLAIVFSTALTCLPVRVQYFYRNGRTQYKKKR